MTTAIEPVAETATQVWAIDSSHTGVEFAVKHFMISTTKGRFSDVTGTLKGDITQPQTFSLEVNIGTESIDTRNEQRDAHLRSADFFDSIKWPAITFVGKRVDGDVSDEFKLIGDLTIRDVTRQIVLDVTNEGSVRDPWGNERIGFSAKSKIDRSDYGLNWNQVLEAVGLALSDEIKISVDVEFTAVAAETSAAA